MNTLSDTLSTSLIYYFRDYGQRVHTLAADLSLEQFWQQPYTYGNSFGHLVLHLTGNLNHYIGAHIAGTDYIRNRELEFNDTAQHPKELTLKKLDQAIDIVISTLEMQDSNSWSEAYEVDGVEFINNRLSMFLNASAHFHHHIGQMIYITKEFSNSSQT